ncbi:hypothetical protein AVEN_69284-1 [Araneus ventricosus]|uniref:Mos1 transposase HTH domain-containing protein n=1 Tax=Araneus ventricosus TaxID=182803 RepID=A0A4Y2K4E8_ARAVE|nr:hypothetical protein AVEN_69284-1 [Araneus ventricosus]
MDSSRSAQRAVIKFLRAEGEHASEIYSRMEEVYGEQCLTRCIIFRWCQRDEAGRVNIKISKGTVPRKAWLWQSLCTVRAQESGSPVTRKCRTPWKTGSVSNPGVSTLKPSTPFLRAGISVSMPMAIIYSCTVPYEL